ncbi:MAG TPA: CBS and ACT domain-containing protein [Methylomirabilota bacterium]|jgi:acetoin utilization protein AcuB
MLVNDIMQRDVVTVTPDTRFAQVLRLLQPRGFRHVPVVDHETVIGIISDRDVKQAMVSLAGAGAVGAELEGTRERLTASEIMGRTVITIGPMETVEEAARLMATQKISALPVTEGGRLVGIVTETDVLDLFVRAMGVLEPSSRLDVSLPDPGMRLGEVVRIVEETGCRIVSLMTLGQPEGEREVVLRVATINPGAAVAALQDRGFRVRDAKHGATARAARSAAQV